MSPHVPGRPLVVLAGWLGCQARSLRRYEALYTKLGFGVVTRIATPKMVVMSVLQESPVTLPSEWPGKRQRRMETMQDVAWDTLREVDASQCSAIMVHAFSNGGCFLWEQVRNILKTRTDNQEVDSKLQVIQSKLLGVVFDSSPAYYSPRSMRALLAALHHCSWRERIGAYAQLLLHVPILTGYRLSELERRTTEYFESMRNDPSGIPQLYLFSKDDTLAQHGPIEELARQRQRLFGQERILLQEWESSPHCGHLLKHPVEYEAAVSTFAEFCLHGDTPRSKL